MNDTYYSNWSSLLLFLLGAFVILVVGYSKYGFSQGVLIGGLGEIGCALWLAWERYTTYIQIQDRRWLINAEQRLFPDIKIDIGSMLYIARVPHFIFRSWGGRMVIFFRAEGREIRQTGIPETLYTQEALKAILEKIISIKPTIELDPEYREFLKQYDTGSPIEIKSEAPRRSVSEIEAYVTSRYGPP